MKSIKPVRAVRLSRVTAVLLAGSLISLGAACSEKPAEKAAAPAAAAATTPAQTPSQPAAAATEPTAAEDPIAAGREIAFDRKKGNCLACHAMAGGDSPGNIGPPLLQMQARFPDKAALKVRIADAPKVNPNTAMPPFGAHKILSGDEIDKVVEFVWTL